VSFNYPCPLCVAVVVELQLQLLVPDPDFKGALQLSPLSLPNQFERPRVSLASFFHPLEVETVINFLWKQPELDVTQLFKMVQGFISGHSVSVQLGLELLEHNCPKLWDTIPLAFKTPDSLNNRVETLNEILRLAESSSAASLPVEAVTSLPHLHDHSDLLAISKLDDHVRHQLKVG